MVFVHDPKQQYDCATKGDFSTTSIISVSTNNLTQEAKIDHNFLSFGSSDLLF